MQLINSWRLYTSSCSIFVWLFQTTNDYMYAMYNDQPPEGHTSLNHGHTKGKETAPNPLNQHNTETVPHHNHWRKVFKMDCHYNCWRATQKLYRYHEQEQTTHRPTCNLHCHHKYRCTCTSQILYTITIHVCITDDEELKIRTIITTTDVLHRNRAVFTATDAQHRYFTVIKLN